MRDTLEMMAFRQMLGGDSWTHAVFLIGVFLVVLFRRDQIISPYMFRVSIILFVLAIILPVVMSAILQYMMQSGGGGGGFLRSGESGAFLQVLMVATGPVLFGLAVVTCIVSMLPAQSRYPAPPQRPQQPHPLD